MHLKAPVPQRNRGFQAGKAVGVRGFGGFGAVALRLHVTAHPQADEFAAVWGQRDVNGHVAAIALDRGGDGVADESAVFV